MQIRQVIVRWALTLALSCAGASASLAGEMPPTLQLAGSWQVRVTLPAANGRKSALTAALSVPRPTMVTVHAEKYQRLPVFNPQAGSGWQTGVPLHGLLAQECTNRRLLDPASLVVRDGPQPDAQRFTPGKDCAADLEWGSVGRLPQGRIRADQPVFIDYRYALLRIDSIVLTDGGRIMLRKGQPHVATPLPPALAKGEHRLANVYLPGWAGKLAPEDLFPILETAYPEPPNSSPSPAERLLPKTMKKLRAGESLRILAWGDSVTEGSFLPDAEHGRWQARLVSRLRQRFPGAKIELSTEAWPARSTADYLTQPPGSEHNYREKVLGRRPDLVVSEFVNDSGLKPQQVEERYGKFLADFQTIGAEWIILTPHYVRPDWMNFNGQREIDKDPRPYVAGLRQFAAGHHVALADASLRWGRLWRQGIPCGTLLTNAVNHPDARGMKIYADSLMALFP